MRNRNLTATELALAWKLIRSIERRIAVLGAGDDELVFAYRRKVMKELSYLERSKPAVRRRLKDLKREEQQGLCTICRAPLPEKYAVLDRFVASRGYTAVNTRLIHADCDTATQKGRSYK